MDRSGGVPEKRVRCTDASGSTCVPERRRAPRTDGTLSEVDHYMRRSNPHLMTGHRLHHSTLGHCVGSLFTCKCARAVQRGRAALWQCCVAMLTRPGFSQKGTTRA